MRMIIGKYSYHTMPVSMRECNHVEDMSRRSYTQVLVDTSVCLFYGHYRYLVKPNG